MKPETERLLGTLEILTHQNIFIWEKEKQDELNIWNLILSQGFVKETDLNLVIEHWQNIEMWGMPTNQKTNDYEYAPYREERKDDNWSDAIAKQRQEYYQELKKICQDNSEELKSYQLLGGGYTGFYVSIVVGQTIDRNWFCLAPIVEDLCCYEQNIISDRVREDISDQTLESIDLILDKLTPVTLYGYYYGGYNQTYQHQIVKGVGTTKEQAIASALQRSGMVVWQTNRVNFSHNRNDKLEKFVNECLQDKTYCHISFWDVGYSFELGKTPANDWIGISNTVEFEYNP